jgi:iron complex outermembrane recepter protein
MKASVMGVSVIAIAVAIASPASARGGQTAPAQTAETGVADPQDAGQAASEPVQGLQDIVVTAQRREENLQRAPIAVVAVSGEELVRAGVREAQDLNKLVPGLKIGQTGSMTQFFVNGVGSGVANAYGDPTIAFNADGIYIARPTGVNGVFYDVNRVEVLKGPQGTLYGRNAAAGAVNVITNRPAFKDEAQVGIDIGNFGLVRFTGFGNVKLSDDLALRVSGLFSRRDGYLSDGYNDEDDQGFRGQLLWQPDPSLTLLLATDFFHQGGKGPAAVPVPFANPDDPWSGPSSAAVNAVLFNATPTVPAANRIQYGKYDGYLDNHYWGVRGEATWTGDQVAVTAVAAHRFTVQYGNSIVGGFQQFQNLRAKQDSLELRASSAGNSAFRWLIGGYYFNEDVNAYARTNRYFQGTSVLDLRPITDKTLAVFTQETLEVVRGLRLTGGFRYTHERKTQDGYNITITGTRIPAIGDATFNASNYKAGIEFDAGPRSLLYASVSTGFKAGGFFQGLAPNTFKPEKLTSYVIGSKNRFLDNRLQLNLEAFYWDYRDKQFASFAVINPAPATAITTINIAKVTFRGVTADVAFTPWHGGQFNGNAQYLNARNDDFIYPSLVPSSQCPSAAKTGGGYTVNCSGKPLSQAPEFSLTAGVTQTFDLDNGGRIAAGFNTHFETRTLASQTMDYVDALYQNAWSMTDLSLSYAPDGNRWNVQLFTNNVFNKAVKTNGASQPTTPTVYFANIMPPRTFGIRLGARF